MRDSTASPVDCRFDRDRRVFLAPSSSGSRVYELTARGFDGLLIVSCTCPAGVKGRQVPAGATKCRHGAAVAHLLAEDGLVRLDGGCWTITAKAAELAPPSAA